MTEANKPILFISDQKGAEAMGRIGLNHDYEIVFPPRPTLIRDMAEAGTLGDYVSRFCAVITDLDIGAPGMDDSKYGVEICALIRGVSKDIPVFLWALDFYRLSVEEYKRFTGVLHDRGGGYAGEEIRAALRKHKVVVGEPSSTPGRPKGLGYEISGENPDITG